MVESDAGSLQFSVHNFGTSAKCCKAALANYSNDESKTGAGRPRFTCLTRAPPSEKSTNRFNGIALD